MNEHAVSYTIEDDIALIVVERPEARNAINGAVVASLARLSVLAVAPDDSYDARPRHARAAATERDPERSAVAAAFRDRGGSR